jgi:hypothetical protein
MIIGLKIYEFVLSSNRMLNLKNLNLLKISIFLYMIYFILYSGLILVIRCLNN